MNNVILLNNQQEVINEEPWTYKQFKDWVDNQVDFAEAMSLPANKKVFDVMMEKNAEAWAEIADMLENRKLIYKMKKG